MFKKELNLYIVYLSVNIDMWNVQEHINVSIIYITKIFMLYL